MLTALYSCRMMKLTLEFGFCEETISSLTFVSKALLIYAEDAELATRFIRIAESLINGHPNEHALSAKLTIVICAVTLFIEPFQALPERLLKGCNSAQIVGDVDNAMMLSYHKCIACIYFIPDLLSGQRDVVYFFRQSVRITCICFAQSNTAHCLTTFPPISSRLSSGESLSSMD
jgi:hypothetical protein